jgi:hypothetical protein
MANSSFSDHEHASVDPSRGRHFSVATATPVQSYIDAAAE